ncbi:RNA 2',3'-cyclic phosphodiesterase [Nocardiopsis oceani]
MSLFVALWPPQEVVDELAQAVRPARPSATGLRWTRPEEWHLTLAFLGEVPEDRLPELTSALGRALGGHPAPYLAADLWGTFPNRAQRASVLWCGVTGEGLHELAGAVRDAARSAGVPVESRLFVPHITLARARPPRDLTEALRALGPVGATGWRADRVHLVESRPGRQDRYRTARTWGLPWGSESQRAPERGTS